MATYKVIQDIEAEDKFLGPLTLKQFVFGAGGLFFGYLNIFALSRGLPFLLVIFTPPMILGIFLAVPWSKDQSTEVWVLAKLRFYFKPRKRIWDQSGLEELVTITAPKKEERPLTDNLSQTEVKSRLQTLSQIIDTHGWAIKDVQYENIIRPQDSADRLISPTTLPQEVPIVDLATIPDVYEVSAATTDNFDRMMQQSSDIRKAQNLDVMDRVRHGEPIQSATAPPVQFTPPPTDYQTYSDSTIDEKALAQELKSRKTPAVNPNSHMRVINPIDPNSPLPPPPNFSTTTDNTSDDIISQNDHQKTQAKTTPQASTPAILELAGNNDLDVATIARQAKREVEGDSDEVVINLH